MAASDIYVKHMLEAKGFRVVCRYIGGIMRRVYEMQT